ncbi:MAG: hypothetical protein J5476_01970 [Lachnospiraceae bacterium]|nr:hypothetical protein [Lachnospiraceae bacterium]
MSNKDIGASPLNSVKYLILLIGTLLLICFFISYVSSSSCCCRNFSFRSFLSGITVGRDHVIAIQIVIAG